MGASSEINRRLFYSSHCKMKLSFVLPKLSKKASRVYLPEISQGRF